MEEDEDLNNQIADIATEVSRDEENPAGFKCNVCGKACKSRRGLTRHSNAKHPDVGSSSGVTMSASTAAPKGSSSSADELSRQKLHPLHLKAFVLKCAEKLSSETNVFHQVCERNFRRGSQRRHQPSKSGEDKKNFLGPRPFFMKATPIWKKKSLYKAFIYKSCKKQLK